MVYSQQSLLLSLLLWQSCEALRSYSGVQSHFYRGLKPEGLKYAARGDMYTSERRLIGSTAIFQPVLGGTVAGAMHAVTGPDHLTGLIVPCANKDMLTGALIGATWGVGHALSTMLVGMVLYLLKSRASVYGDIFDKISKFSSFLVGLSLVLIGVVGLFETLNHTNAHTTLEGTAESTRIPWGFILGNGVLHGFSIDGAVSIIPSLALDSWMGALVYLISYSSSTTVVMSAAAAALSAGVSRLERLLGSNAPQKLAYYSSLISIMIGALWSFRSLL